MDRKALPVLTGYKEVLELCSRKFYAFHSIWNDSDILCKPTIYYVTFIATRFKDKTVQSTLRYLFHSLRLPLLLVVVVLLPPPPHRSLTSSSRLTSHIPAIPSPKTEPRTYVPSPNTLSSGSPTRQRRWRGQLRTHWAREEDARFCSVWLPMSEQYTTMDGCFFLFLLMAFRGRFRCRACEREGEREGE